ncbi:calpain [Brachionus plicatilis]|uniref:Calpain n=1 Tax=Brachionus plicatilis TaxID=10195 RepID=A0A3M7S2G9_BRAPC|nr:calpain [Brachionus plicatilis]
MSEIKAYLDQDYAALKSKAKSSGELFVDDKFPANDSSIFKFENVVFEEIYWKRPHEIVQDPQFIVNKIEPSDLNQGAVGNCWLIAAASCVLSSPELTERTIPTNQSFDKSDYAGIFHFKFWVNGEWVDVVIDDFLPQSTFFLQKSCKKKEMFGPLFEKAYAKLNICYEFLIAGYPHDALVDLTGGVNEVYDLNLSRPTADQEKLLDPNTLWEILYKTVNYGSLSIGTISTDKDGNGPVLPNGLVICLIYSIINEYELIEINGSFDQIREPGSKKPNNNSIKLMRCLMKFRNKLKNLVDIEDDLRDFTVN